MNRKITPIKYKKVLKTLNLWVFLQIITSEGYVICAFQLIVSAHIILLLHYSLRFRFKD